MLNSITLIIVIKLTSLQVGLDMYPNLFLDNTESQYPISFYRLQQYKTLFCLES